MALWDHAVKEMMIPHDRIVLFGESLGGGVAVQLAAEQSRQGTPPEGLIIQSSFSSLADVASNHYPIVPVRFLLWDQFDSCAQIPDIECRYLHLHGTADRVVPFQCGEELFASAPSDIEKEFVTLDDAGHNDLYSEARNFVPFSRALRRWLDSGGEFALRKLR